MVYDTKIYDREFLLKIFDYNRDEGKLYWKAKPSRYSNNIKIGTEAGHYVLRGDGRFVKIFSQRYPVHRLIFFLEHNFFPATFIFHIDGDNQNNHYSNLKLSNTIGKKQPTFLKKIKYGITGTRLMKRKTERWAAWIHVGGKNRYLATFDTRLEAYERYKKELKNLGFKVYEQL